VALVAGVAWAQDVEADQARALLEQGVKQYAARQYKSAKATLLNVDRAKLGDAGKKMLDEHLNKVNEAVKQQSAGMETYQSAREALGEGNLREAQRLFEKAAANAYLPEPVRKDAAAQAVLAVERMNAANAPSETGSPAPAPKPMPTATEPPAPRPETGGEVDDATAVKMKELQARIRRAKELIAKGNEAIDNDRTDRAVAYFREAVEVAPEYRAARQRLAFAQSLAAGGGGAGAISQLERKRAIKRGMVNSQFAEAMRRSYEALQEPRNETDFAKAAQEANYAKSLVETNRNLYSASAYRAKLKEVNDRLDYIKMAREQWQQRQLKQRMEEIEAQERRREREVARQRSEKLRTLRQRARTLRNEQKYAQAIEVLDEIIALDPEDSWAIEWRSELVRFRLLLEHKHYHRQMMTEEVKQFNAITEAQIPWHKLLTYPRDWPERTLRRQAHGAGEAAESEANRATRKKMGVTLPRVDLTGIPFQDALEFLRTIGDVNIYVKWGALIDGGIAKTAPVTVKLENVTFQKALETILEDVSTVSANLQYVIDEGVITISTEADLDERVATQVYDIRDLIVRVPTFAGPRISLDSTTGNNGTNGTSGTTGGLFGNTGTGTGTGTGTDTEENTMSRQELIDSILSLIRETIDRDSWAQAGGRGSVRELGGQIIVTQTAQNQSSLLDLLGQLREARALQINVEARFITVNTGFLNHIGIDLDFFFNLGSPTTRQVDPVTGGWATDPLTGARLVRTINGVRVGQWGGHGNLEGHTTPIPVSLGSSGYATPQQTTVPGSIGGTATQTGLSLAGAYLDQIQVDFLINATQAHQASRTLTAPRLTLYNGQRAYVSVGTEQAYVSSVEFVPGTGTNATGGFEPVIGQVTTGTVLDVEATVSADRRYVTMTVRPQVSTINGFTQWQGTIDAQGNPIEGSGLVQLPNITRQVVECTVSVPDGGTLLLGGQRLAGEVERTMGVPLLSKVPILKRVFTNTAKVRDEQTLLILVKPEIIIQREYEEAAFPP
jgi:general secretion pathway protein D